MSFTDQSSASKAALPDEVAEVVRKLRRFAGTPVASPLEAAKYALSIQSLAFEAATLLSALASRAQTAEAVAAKSREEALEEAAKVAESHGFINARDTDWDGGVNFTRKFIAEHIRARKSISQQGEDR